MQRPSMRAAGIPGVVLGLALLAAPLAPAQSTGLWNHTDTRPRQHPGITVHSRNQRSVKPLGQPAHPVKPISTRRSPSPSSP